MPNSKQEKKGICNLLIYGQFCQQVHHIHKLLYLKSLGCCKKSIRRRFVLFNFRVITKNNMMHQREDSMMSLSFQIKMSLVRIVGKIVKTTLHYKSFKIDLKQEINLSFLVSTPPTQTSKRNVNYKKKQINKIWLKCTQLPLKLNSFCMQMID